MRQDLFEALGGAIAVELGERRALVTGSLILADPDAAAQEFAASVGEASGAGRRVVVLEDVRTHQVAGELCSTALRHAGLDVHVHTLEDIGGHPPACDDATRDRLLTTLPVMDVIVGVGSGVISDLSKWVAFERGCPAAVFATAASMNGYTAANVAPAIAGVKSLFSARAHRVVASSPRILAAAPHAMTTAGLGDVIAKWVSTADWRMNQMLFGEPYSDAVAGIIDDVERQYLDRPAAIAAHDEDAIAGVFRALVFSGCAMTLQGSSMPASGGEHLISHTLDMRATAEGVPHDLHGRQVGVGTLFVAALYERILAIETPKLHAAALPLDRQGWGTLASAVAPHHDKQGRRLAEGCTELAKIGAWQRLRGTLAPMLPPAGRVKHVLQAAGGAHRVTDLGIDRERFRWAVLNGAQMRQRFTSLDLAWATGVLPDAADEIIDQWLL